MDSNCSGREFLEYAKEDLKNYKYKTAIYFGCIAAEEASKIGDFETFVKALDFTRETRIEYSKGLRRDLLVCGLASSRENLIELMTSECKLINGDLSDLLDEFSIKPDRKQELLASLTKKVKEVFMDIAEENNY